MLTPLTPVTARQYHRFWSAVSPPLSRKAAAAGQVQLASVEPVAGEWTVADADAADEAGAAAATEFDSTRETDNAAGETEAKADAAVEADGPAEVGDAAGETEVDAAAEAEADVDTTGESGLGMWAPVSTCG